MKIITSVTVFNDAVGMRMSATYSEIDESTGRVISDNKNHRDRIQRISVTMVLFLWIYTVFRCHSLQQRTE